MDVKLARGKTKPETGYKLEQLERLVRYFAWFRLLVRGLIVRCLNAQQTFELFEQL